MLDALIIAAFVLAFPLTLFYNRFAPSLTSQRPRVMRGPLFFLLVMVWTYGSVAAVFFTYGWIGLACWVVMWAFDKYSLRFFLRQWVHRTTPFFLSKTDFHPEKPDVERFALAREMAERLAHQNCRS